MLHVNPGTIVVYSDIGCPWAHAAIQRLRDARRDLRLEDEVEFDHRAFVLELINRRPTPKRILDAELPVAGALAPSAGWQMWQEDPATYPVTTFPALEAVQAAKSQGLRASDQLDAGLRRAFFGESRCISLLHVILEVAGECGEVDAGLLEKALAEGSARSAVLEQHRWATSPESGVEGSPQMLLADGTSEHNPGVEVRWEGEKGVGFPVVTGNDPDTYHSLVRRAASRPS